MFHSADNPTKHCLFCYLFSPHSQCCICSSEYIDFIGNIKLILEILNQRPNLNEI